MTCFRLATRLGSLLLAIAGNGAIAAEPRQLKPSTPWTADFAEESCGLGRTFESDGNEVYLELRKYGPGEKTVVTAAARGIAIRKKPPEVRFVPDPEIEVQPYYSLTQRSDGWKGAIWSDSLLSNSDERAITVAKSNLRKPSDERLDEIRGYEIDGVFEDDIELLTGSLRKPEEMMQACLTDLTKGWGLDRETQETLLRRIEPTYKEPWWKDVGQAQRDVRVKRGIATLHLRLLVDETGKPTDCRISELAQPDDKQAGKLCSVFLEKASFTPALDSTSQPVKSFYLTVLTTVVRTEFSH